MNLDLCAPLAERIADRIREGVIAGQFRPGERLTEVAIAAWLGVSNNPVREAFQLLEREGLITKEPRRGAQVREFIRGIPSIPLWLALSAALPKDWPALWVYFGITIILSLIGWTGLARVVRGRFLALREEDFIMAAKLAGASEMRIIVRHMAPSFLSHIIASLTLTIPGMILSETSLSFLGLGLRPPVISWGVLLQEAQNIRALAHFPWLLVPGLAVIVVVLCFNFLGDGVRDAADPYSR